MKNNKINKLMESLNKEFGKNVVISGKQLDETKHPLIPSGSISVDLAINGGIPTGRIVILSGNFSSCKSLLAYKTISNYQRKAKKEVPYQDGTRWVICEKTEKDSEPLVCALIESETMSYMNDWAENIGINTEDLILVRPDSMEQALNIAESLQKAGVELIVHDSYTAYSPSKVLDTEMGESVQMGIKPKMLQDYHARVNSINNKAIREGKIPTTVIGISQLREKIGSYGNPEYTPGGNTMKYDPAIEIRLRSGEPIKDSKKDIIGYEIKFTVHKQKAGRGKGRTGTFDVYIDDGGICPAGSIDNSKEIFIESILFGVIEQKGSWFFYKGEQLAQGKDSTYEKLRNEPELYNKIKNELYCLIKGQEVKDEVETTNRKGKIGATKVPK